jgi:hypothetical protein
MYIIDAAFYFPPNSGSGRHDRRSRQNFREPVLWLELEALNYKSYDQFFLDYNR